MALISTLTVKNHKSVQFGTGVKWNKGEIPVRLVIRTEGLRFVVCKETLAFDTDEGAFVHHGFYGGNYEAGEDWLKAQDILANMMRDA